MRRLWYYYLYLLVVWGSFRYFVQLPDVIEELWFKPLIWLVPLFWWNIALPEKLMMFGKRWFNSIFLGVLVGVVYYVLVRRFSLSSTRLNIDTLGVVLATAVIEELAFSGFIMGYLEKIQKGKVANLWIIGVMVALIRLPILWYVYHTGWVDSIGVMFVAGASGIINAWIRTKTENVAGSILARVGMNLAVLG